MTGTKQLGEASPNDRYFGCGLGMNDPDVGDVTKWTGQNLLGKALMEVRTELKYAYHFKIILIIYQVFINLSTPITFYCHCRVNTEMNN